MTAAGSFVAETGDGNDKVTVGEIARKSASANPGGLSPQMLPTLTAASVGIRTGAGNDEVKLFQAAVDQLLAVDLGLGADVLRAEGNVVTGMAWLNGGLGIDALYNYGNRFGQVRITGFEKIDPATEPGSVGGSRGGVVLFPLRPGGGIVR